MKRNFLTTLVLFTLVCALLVSGCEDDPKDESRAAPTWLVGTWSNAGATFTINADFSFHCDLTTINPTPPPLLPARVLGNLDYTSTGLGPNDFLMRNMTAAGPGVPDASFTPGNASLGPQLAGFANLIGTLTPNADRTQFTFTSTNIQAEMFFGAAGPYTKQGAD